MNHPRGVPRIGWLLLCTAVCIAAPVWAQDSTVDLRGVTYVASHGTETDIVLDAQAARYQPDGEIVLLQGVDFTLSPTQKDGFALTCNQGELDLNSSNFVGTGKVRGRTGDGRKFETERVVYQHKQGVVTANSPVVIREKGTTLRGGGFRYRVDDGTFSILGGAMVVAQ